MPKKKPTVLKASRIELTDSEGRIRITLDAGDKEGYASICLFARDGKSVQISTHPLAGISVQILGRRGKPHIFIGLADDDRGGISISDRSGKLGTILGEEPGTSTHRLILFKRGQHFWKTPSGKKSRTMRSSQRRSAGAARRGSP